MNIAKTCKVILIGDSSTGKTSIINTYISEHEEVRPTIGASNSNVEKMINGKKVRFQIWDTAGQEQYKSILPLYFRNAVVVICVYDITNEQSFNDLNEYIQMVHNNCQETTKIVIIGNKTDLEDERVVPFAKAEEYAKENNALFYHETSKLNIDLIDFLFDKILDYLSENDKNEEEKKQVNNEINMNDGNMNNTEDKKCC